MSRLTNLLLAALCLAPSLTFAQPAAAPLEGRLKNIQQTRTIAVAYRPDATPFSFEDPDKKPVGYTVDICRAVIESIGEQLGVGPLQVRWVPVTVQTRFSAVASGQADMECGASTVTLGRKNEVGFSSLIFMDGVGLLVLKSTPGYSLQALGGKKIGVLAGTSNERALADATKGLAFAPTLVPLASRDDGMAQLQAGAIDAFAGDRVLLLGLVAQGKGAVSTALLTDALSYEPYAIVLPRGDWGMQQAVDTGLARLYSSPALPKIYERWFSAMGEPSPALLVMYALGRLPK